MLGRLLGVGRVDVGEVQLVALNQGSDLPLYGGLLDFYLVGHLVELVVQHAVRLKGRGELGL